MARRACDRDVTRCGHLKWFDRPNGLEGDNGPNGVHEGTSITSVARTDFERFGGDGRPALDGTPLRPTFF